MIHRCPNRLIPAAIHEALPFVHWSENGSWPVRGGILDQSATLVDAKRLFEGEFNRLQAEDMKKMEQEAGSGGR